jgi:minor extracellular serine protease Vpr
MRMSTLGAVAVAATILLLAGTVHGAAESTVRAAARAWSSAFPDRPKASFGQRMIVVLSSPAVAERTAASSQKPTAEDERNWVADIDGLRESLLSGLAERGVQIRPDHVYTHVLNGFSATLDARAVAELERAPVVVGVYPVRAVYPAQLGAATGPGEIVDAGLAGFDGSGVSIALLDSGLDLSRPSLAGRIASGYDLVAGDLDVSAEPSPSDPGRLEAHATRMAGIIARVAPGARIVPFRVLGWHETDAGAAVLGRSDVLIAGLERAADPNGDGLTLDHADVVLAPVVEPFAAFPDSPEARAVTGATDLGALVVAPVGNDGDAGIAFGSIAAPGGSSDALSVGAVDSRRTVFETSTTLAGKELVLDESARLLGAVGTGDGLSLEVVGLQGPSLAEPGRIAGATAGGAELGDFFDPAGVSRVAGRAVLVPADGTSLARKVANANAAGAAALLVYGSELPAGALELDARGALPVVGLPAEAGEEAVGRLVAGERLTVGLGASQAVGNAAGRVAPFSSGGLAFDGRVRPDVVAPGIGLATDDVRTTPRESAAYATATGTSAASAVAAATAAVVKQARPGLEPAELRSALIGSASPLAEPVTREGAGLLDAQAAARTRIVVEPGTVSFGRATGEHWSGETTISVKNVSRRSLEVGFAFVSDQIGAPRVRFTAEPAHLNLGPRASASVLLGIAPAGLAAASGVLLVQPAGSAPVRVPWALGRRSAGGLVSSLSLSNWEFTASNSAPAVVAFQAGRVSPVNGSLEPVGRLELELWTTEGTRLGVLTTLRNLLPGRYAVGLTGRGPNGKVLSAGTYVLRLRAQPVDAEEGTPPSTVQTVFRIKESS